MAHAHQDRIDKYLQGSDQLAAAIDGLAREELTAFPVADTWSIHQIVIHVLDSDLVMADRMKRIVAEERPLLMGFDETRFANRLHYHDQDPALAAELFAKNRRLVHQFLSRLPEEAFDRTGIHSERGRVTLADMIDSAIEHLDHHLKFVRKKRVLLGKGS